MHDRVVSRRNRWKIKIHSESCLVPGRFLRQTTRSHKTTAVLKTQNTHDFHIRLQHNHRQHEIRTVTSNISP